MSFDKNTMRHDEKDSTKASVNHGGLLKDEAKDKTGGKDDKSGKGEKGKDK